MQEPPPNDRHYCDRNRARAQNEIEMHVWMRREREGVVCGAGIL